jgi:predicted transcriptional regulator
MRTLAAGLKRAGFSNAKIAERMGVSERSVKTHMHKMKAKRRLDGRGGNRGKFSLGPIALEAMDTVKEVWAKEDGDA